jgi:SNF2 family DNA or RNA helicase
MGYSPKTEPYAHQKEALDKTAPLAYAALFMQQGTGKSKVAIDRSTVAFQKRKIDGTIILCPKSLTETWVEELETHCPDPYVHAVWNPSLTKRVKAELESVLYLDSSGTQPFIIMNIEAARTQKGSKLLHYWTRHKRIHLVVDESSWVKTPSAKQTVATQNLARTCVARTILTGTPVSNSPADYYSQLGVLTPNPLGFTNYYSFRARYCELEKKIIRFKKPRRSKKGRIIKSQEIIQITGPKNSEELLKRLEPFCVFVKKKDCLDLPDKIYSRRYCDMTKEQQRLYSSLTNRIITEVRENEELTVEIVLTRLLRLQQLIGGYLPNDDTTEAEPIGGINPKMELLMETINDYPGPTLIWARFQAEHAGIYKRMIEDEIPAKRIGFITGPTPKDEREQNRKLFQKGKQHYLICTQSCAGYGYTLTAAENEIYYSNTFSLEHREQSEDRAHRIGQTKHVNIIDLMMRKTVDQKIYDALRTKRNVAELLTTLNFEEFF